MSSTVDAWQGDWRERVKARVRSAGFETVTDFLRMHPGEPYIEIAKRLGADIAAVQLESLQFAEAEGSGNLRSMAIDSLVREFAYHLPQGWKDNPGGDFETAGVYADWAARLEVRHSKLKRFADAVWAALKEAQPPAGWRPFGPDDATIVAAFDKGWPDQSA